MKRDTWKASRDDYLEALRNQNPWERTRKVPEVLSKSVRRPLAEELWQTMLQNPYRFQMVLGPRRVGKTVALYQTVQSLIEHGIPSDKLWFLRLDHPLLMHYELGPWAKSLIAKFGGTDESPLYLFLDEVNYSNNWDKWLKTFFDERWPVRVIATSSSTAALRNRTVESGVGRWSEQFLMPYSYSEFLSLQKADITMPQSHGDLFGTLNAAVEAKVNYAPQHSWLTLFLLVGGFPELLDSLRKSDVEGELFRSQQVLRSEAVQRVASMDIPQAFDIRNPIELEKLLYILAGQMCGLMNVQGVSSDLGMSRATVHQYINYLERAYLIFTTHNYGSTESGIQKTGRKVFFVDGAVRNAALQRGLAPMHDSVENGLLIENAVASHLFALHLQSGVRLFHWRERQQHEVDFVYGDPESPIAFEVARGDHHLRGLREIQKRFPKLRGRCFVVSATNSEHKSPQDDPDGIGRIPLQTFLLAVGSFTHAQLRRRLGIVDRFYA